MLSNHSSYSTADVMNLLKIGRNTLRLYEEMRLIENVPRTDSGYREYSADHVENLKFILKAKEAGFTLNEIKELLKINNKEKRLTCGTVSAEVSAKVSEIDREIEILNKKKTFLNQFLQACNSNSTDRKCDVIRAGFNKSACC